MIRALICLPCITLDYIPVYFQAVKDASPIRSGVDVLPMALFISLFALATGAGVGIIGKYRVLNVVGWILLTVGFGILTLMKADIGQAKWVGDQIVVAAGMGVLVRIFGQVYTMMCYLTSYCFGR